MSPRACGSRCYGNSGLASRMPEIVDPCVPPHHLLATPYALPYLLLRWSRPEIRGKETSILRLLHRQEDSKISERRGICRGEGQVEGQTRTKVRVRERSIFCMPSSPDHRRAVLTELRRQHHNNTRARDFPLSENHRNRTANQITRSRPLPSSDNHWEPQQNMTLNMMILIA